MDTDPALGHRTEEFSAAEEENIVEEHGSHPTHIEGTASTEVALPDVSTEYDTYQLNISLAVVETECDEIESEFNDALTEINGEKSFPCAMCDKVCKSKGGLTRHTNSKHSTVAQPKTAFCKDSVTSIIESIKAKITKEKLYGTQINESIKSASCTDALYDALCPLYLTFYQKKNQDKLVQSFFGLIPQSSKLLNCEDYKAANLIMIHIPDKLVGFYHTECSQAELADLPETESPKQIKYSIDPVERGPLTYVAGYVVSKLFQTYVQGHKRKAVKPNEQIQSLLQNMKSTNQSTSSFISARTRGGLVDPSNDLVGILEEAECLFRKELDKSKQTMRKIPTETVCNAALNSPVVKSLWDNIVLSSGVDPSCSTQKLCLENVIKLYLKVRSFSYARDFLTKYKIEQKQVKKRALRKEMKLSEHQ